jgi:hypothetical protein
MAHETLAHRTAFFLITPSAAAAPRQRTGAIAAQTLRLAQEYPSFPRGRESIAGQQRSPPQRTRRNAEAQYPPSALGARNRLLRP